jgi:hypothetical protein
MAAQKQIPFEMQSRDKIGLMEKPDGWSFVCKLCGKDHEVPEEILPYWMDSETSTGIRRAARGVRNLCSR